MKINEITRCSELSELCEKVRALVDCGAYEQCEPLICEAMENYPHAPQPHNLMGILMEKTGNHACAMKHFRAAWALDPTYTPASQNLSNYGTFSSSGPVAFDACDCPEPPAPTCTIEYDANGVGHVVRRKK